MRTVNLGSGVVVSRLFRYVSFPRQLDVTTDLETRCSGSTQMTLWQRMHGDWRGCAELYREPVLRGMFIHYPAWGDAPERADADDDVVAEVVDDKCIVQQESGGAAVCVNS